MIVILKKYKKINFRFMNTILEHNKQKAQVKLHLYYVSRIQLLI